MTTKEGKRGEPKYFSCLVQKFSGQCKFTFLRPCQAGRPHKLQPQLPQPCPGSAASYSSSQKMTTLNINIKTTLRWWAPKAPAPTAATLPRVRSYLFFFTEEDDLEYKNKDDINLVGPESLSPNCCNLAQGP